ncbi:hypothetical protein [Brevundimonas sp. Root1423]|uniref:hypothetical protein n=1 Tax=Brevundimonas sp. Root1423 TaxID=1736462 RepID=UPI0006F664FA|nr:hypothetical protein [Brevundimonas sp. Root1423]KQY96635.1 hypothetical protein ASD25_01965 [Brevundimonas sp. Root1423]
MFDTLYAQIGTAISLVVVAFAFLKGDEPERVGGGAFALALLASLLLQDDSRLSGPQWGLMIVDTAMLWVFAALAWKSRRSWPVWSGGLQALIVMSHLLTVVDLRPPMAAFYAVMNMANYGILLTLALGTFRSWRDRRTDGLE